MSIVVPEGDELGFGHGYFGLQVQTPLSTGLILEGEREKEVLDEDSSQENSTSNS